MTEEEWVGCTDPEPMLELLRDRASDRKLRLFACACCRRDARLLTDDRHRNVVEAAERFADGLLSETEFAEAMHPVVDLWAHIPSHQESAWGLAESMTAATRHLEGASGAFDAAHFAAGGLACLQAPMGDRPGLPPGRPRAPPNANCFATSSATRPVPFASTRPG